ncbi:STM3941 family protein [Vibrio mimicus]|uniref:STM3941 family protein n=1 Tax=Vibrio mimicus TaxID=674 RepID=UPI002FF163F7
MNTSEDLVISLSKKKITLLILSSLVFVTLGAWFLSMDVAEIESQKKFNSPIIIYSVGAISTLFFGACGIYCVRKLFDKKPGIIISKRGVFDNSSGIGAGWIPWQEITGISSSEIHKQKLIFLKVKDPSKYYNTGNKLKQRIVKLNVKMFGTPIIISVNALKIDFDTLVSTIEEYIKRYSENA